MWSKPTRNARGLDGLAFCVFAAASENFLRFPEKVFRGSGENAESQTVQTPGIASRLAPHCGSRGLLHRPDAEHAVPTKDGPCRSDPYGFSHGPREQKPLFILRHN